MGFGVNIIFSAKFCKLSAVVWCWQPGGHKSPALLSYRAGGVLGVSGVSAGRGCVKIGGKNRPAH